jgi:transcriptional regulator with XRE-family HTH domain
MAFGKQIKRLRENAGITAAAMVQLIGLPNLNRYKSWEQGDYDPKFEDRKIIENFFKISLDKIIKLEEIPKELLLKLPSKVTNSDIINPLKQGS